MKVKSNQIRHAAKTFRLLGDPTRLRLIEAIDEGRGKLCVSELAHEIGSSISATSHQLAKLEKMGMVRPCREGKKVCYCINDSAPATKHIKALLKLIRKTG